MLRHIVIDIKDTGGCMPLEGILVMFFIINQVVIFYSGLCRYTEGGIVCGQPIIGVGHNSETLS